MNTQPYTVAVRTLCAFTAKTGDLDLRFTPSPSAQEGVAGHASVRAKRTKHQIGYRAEVSLEGNYRMLQVRGRADGYDPQRNRIEEIKTHRGDLARLPDNHRALHWAQAKIYGWLMCQKLSLPSIEVALVYFDIGDQTETVLCETHAAPALQLFFETCCQQFLAWAEHELAHRIALHAALGQLAFPFPAFRTGQRQLAESAYRATSGGRSLLMQAPTGIGKTVGTLFPVLKAMPLRQIDRIFYLTAKTSGRRLALDALALIAPASRMPLRVIELIARDKACEHPDKMCHGDSCPLAKGFYDRLPAARSAMLTEAQFDRTALRQVALEHQVCPYYLGQEMAQWSDVCVGDYNYYFDQGAMLHTMANEQQWRVTTLIDEAHNLVERARKMYSAELWQADLKTLRANAIGPLKTALDRLNRQWNSLSREQLDDCQSYSTIADRFREALAETSAAISDHLAQQLDAADGADPALQRFYFDLLLFARLADTFADHSLFDIERRGKQLTSLHIRNLIPATFLQPRFADTHASILFSATLNPARFYRDMLGLPSDTPWIDVPSPFHADQLRVNIAADISTRWRERDASIGPIAALIAEHYARQPGNYLAFFSSFDYLDRVAAALASLDPALPLWSQSRSMDEASREAFLARFAPGGCGIGFAVLGGAFGEGIDLPGDRLVGAFIATLGLPQVNRFNEQLRQRMQQTFGAGYEYAYLYPGLQKVVQAAGRVIRSSSDRGSVVLIDPRFADARLRPLLPAWWKIAPPGQLNDDCDD